MASLQNDDALRFLHLMSKAFRKDAPLSLTSFSSHVSPIKYFDEPILPPRLTAEEIKQMRKYRNQATAISLNRPSSRGKEPRISMSTSSVKRNLAQEALVGLTREDNKASYGIGSAPLASVGVPVVQSRRIKLPPSNDDESFLPISVGPISSPKHRQPKEVETEQTELILPPHEVYPPIQVMMKPQIVHEAETQRALRPDVEARTNRSGASSPRRNFATGRGAKPLHARGYKQTTTPSKQALESLGAIAKGHMVRSLLRTDKAKDVIQTIMDTRRLIAEFDDDSQENLSTSDKEFLRRARAQLSTAKNQLAAIVLDSTPEERVKLLRRQRGVQQEKALRSSAGPRLKTGDGSGYISDATKRFLMRKQEEASRPQTAPNPTRHHAESSTLKSSLQPSPKHTDFLRRRAGVSAGGKHSDAPWVPPAKSKVRNENALASERLRPTTAGSPRMPHRTPSTGSPKPRTTASQKDGSVDTRIPQPVHRK